MPQLTNWESIAKALFNALNSFMAYDGYGQGGADDSNRGDWLAAEKAQALYRQYAAAWEQAAHTQRLSGRQD